MLSQCQLIQVMSVERLLKSLSVLHIWTLEIEYNLYKTAHALSGCMDIWREQPLSSHFLLDVGLDFDLATPEHSPCYL